MTGYHTRWTRLPADIFLHHQFPTVRDAEALRLRCQEARASEEKVGERLGLGSGPQRAELGIQPVDYLRRKTRRLGSEELQPATRHQGREERI